MDQLASSLELHTQRMDERGARSRDKYDGFIVALKGEQERFQEEMRLTLAAFRQIPTTQGKGHSTVIQGEEEGYGRNEGAGFGSVHVVGSGSGHTGGSGSGNVLNMGRGEMEWNGEEISSLGTLGERIGALRN